jgi:hypothetical protein
MELILSRIKTTISFWDHNPGGRLAMIMGGISCFRDMRTAATVRM